MRQSPWSQNESKPQENTSIHRTKSKDVLHLREPGRRNQSNTNRKEQRLRKQSSKSSTSTLHGLDSEEYVKERIKELSRRAGANHAKKRHNQALAEYDEILSIVGEGNEGSKNSYLQLTADVLSRKAKIHESMNNATTAMDLYFDAARIYDKKRRSKCSRSGQKISVVLASMARIQLKQEHADFALDLFESSYRVLQGILNRFNNNAPRVPPAEAEKRISEIEAIAHQSIAILKEIEGIMHMRGDDEAAKETHAEYLRLEETYLSTSRHSDANASAKKTPMAGGGGQESGGRYVAESKSTEDARINRILGLALDEYLKSGALSGRISKNSSSMSASRTIATEEGSPRALWEV